MNRIVPILMLILIGYNSIGYYFVFCIQREKAEVEIKSYIDAGFYSESELILFKVPVQTYLQSSQSDFNRVEGDFKYHGKFYEMVKQRIENDTLYVFCLDNEKQQKLYENLSEHIKLHIADVKGAKTNPAKKAFNTLIKEYVPKQNATIHSALQLTSLTQNFTLYKGLFVNTDCPTTTPPPRV